MTTLVYVGANTGNSLWGIFDKFDKVYAFEPDPEMFQILNKKYRQFDWVTLINAACSSSDGEADFYITPNRVSSSLSNVNIEKYGGDSAFKVVKVKTINLAEYLKDNNVEYIDHYYSDCQGSDLNILKTIKEYINDKRIGELFIETHGDNIEIYDGLNNQFGGFKELLSENYEFVHASLGSQNGRMVQENDIPKGEKEWDSYWRLK